MGYAIDFGEDFLTAFLLLNPSVQETILDNLEALAEQREAPTVLSGDAIHPQIEWHRHRGMINEMQFDVVTWVGVNHERKTMRVLLLLDLSVNE